jgi:hypothetical protein
MEAVAGVVAEAVVRAKVAVEALPRAQLPLEAAAA